MTPRLIVIEIEVAADKAKRDHQKMKWHTWHIAALGRTEKMPELNDFMGVQAKPQTADEQDKIFQQFVTAMAGR